MQQQNLRYLQACKPLPVARSIAGSLIPDMADGMAIVSGLLSMPIGTSLIVNTSRQVGQLSASIELDCGSF